MCTCWCILYTQQSTIHSKQMIICSNIKTSRLEQEHLWNFNFRNTLKFLIRVLGLIFYYLTCSGSTMGVLLKVLGNWEVSRDFWPCLNPRPQRSKTTLSRRAAQCARKWNFVQKIEIQIVTKQQKTGKHVETKNFTWYLIKILVFLHFLRFFVVWSQS